MSNIKNLNVADILFPEQWPAESYDQNSYHGLTGFIFLVYLQTVVEERCFIFPS